MRAVVNTSTIQGLIDRLKNPAPLLAEIGRILSDSTKDRIKNTKTDPNGAQWAPWALGTLIGRTRRGTAGTGLLYESGALYNSIETQINPTSVLVGSSSPYARFLQSGTPHMPARAFLGISTQDQGRIDVVLKKYIQSR
jgi:phage virion morphogenesis protein